MVVTNSATRPSGRQDDDEAVMKVGETIPMGKRVPTADLFLAMDKMIQEKEEKLQEEAKRTEEAEKKKREEREKEYQRRAEEKRKALEAAAKEEEKKRSTVAYKLEHAVAHPVDFIKDTAKKPTKLKEMTRTESEIKEETIPQDQYNITPEEISPAAFVKDVSHGLYQIAETSSRGVKSAFDSLAEFQKSFAESQAKMSKSFAAQAAFQAKKNKALAASPAKASPVKASPAKASPAKKSKVTRLDSELDERSTTYEMFAPQAFFAELVELAKDLEITPRRRPTRRSKSPSKRSKSRSRSPRKAPRPRSHSRSHSKSRSSDSSYDSF